LLQFAARGPIRVGGELARVEAVVAARLLARTATK